MEQKLFTVTEIRDDPNPENNGVKVFLHGHYADAHEFGHVLGTLLVAACEVYPEPRAAISQLLEGLVCEVERNERKIRSIPTPEGVHFSMPPGGPIGQA